MISENFQNDRISLYSCLLVNRSWCEAIVPLLWKIPGYILLTEKAENIIFNIILSHFSEESRDVLMKKGIDLFTEIYQKPSFNYIHFWRHLDLHLFDRIITRNFDKSDISMIRNELLKLFVNNNTNFISLFFPYDYKCQVNWNIRCFSNLKYFYFCNDIDQNILKELATVSKSIKIFNCDVVNCNDISGIIRLIEVQKNLDSVRISRCDKYETWQSIEEVLIKKAITVQNLYLSYNWHFDVDLKFLSHFVNLKSLEIIECSRPPNQNGTILNLNQSEKMSLPALKILKTNQFGAKYKLLRSFLANWKGRHTMLLQIWPVNYILGHEKEVNRLYELIEYYEAKGIVKKIDWEINWYNESEEFNWIKKRCFR
ncbi:hypothetical protein RhiirB3_442156 [Rhizophagus irregularis]|nr:hypothetical protein RhiirB3_442156 [Rhizophagus irregularis]